MKKILFPAAVLFFLLSSCHNSSSSTSADSNSSTKKADIIQPVGEGGTEITTTSYKTFVNSYPVVLVDVSATWCGPCRRLAPMLTDLVQTMPGKFLLVKSDSDRDSNLADSLGIKSLPTLLLYKNGALQWRNEGVVDGIEETIAGKISEAQSN